jgi:uncharacterized protein (UPF0212 family)
MRAPDQAAMLDAWERGLGSRPPARALALLAAALPETDETALAALPLGARDRQLLDLREMLFGPQLNAIADCPDCGERLETQFPVEAIRYPAIAGPPAEIALEAEGLALRCRLPATLDLLAIPAGADLASARDILLARCVVEACGADGRPLAGALSDAAAAQVSSALAAADPQAAIDLALECPSCGARFAAALDIAGWLVTEVHAWAQRMLGEVAILARAFGWREADVLALSTARRRAYLELALR